MKILVLYTTVDGHTGKIATALSEQFEALGHEVFVTETSDPGYCDPATFDAAMLCSPIRMGKYPDEFVKFISEWRSSLEEVPTALVTSSLFITCEDPDELGQAEAYPVALTEETGWKPEKIFNVAGSLNFPEYDFFTRWIMRRAAKAENWPAEVDREYDFTDWDGLSAIAEEFVSYISKRAA